MNRIRPAKLFFFIAVLLFVAKPFLGFSMFSSSNPPSVENIFVKSFTKRKIEFSEDSSFNMIAVQKRLAEPVTQFLLRFSFLIGMLFPAFFAKRINITNRFLNDLQLSLSSVKNTYLLNGKLII